MTLLAILSLAVIGGALIGAGVLVWWLKRVEVGPFR